MARDPQGADLRGVEITLYKSPSCGCCGSYVEYLRERGGSVVVEEREGMGEIKRMLGVPRHLESCHTATVGGYVVEGHVPADAIRKLLDEKPDIGGISLPEMPAGAPGMGGVKTEPFVVHAVGEEGKDLGAFVTL